MHGKRTARRGRTHVVCDFRWREEHLAKARIKVGSPLDARVERVGLTAVLEMVDLRRVVEDVPVSVGITQGMPVSRRQAGALVLVEVSQRKATRLERKTEGGRKNI